MCTQGSGIDWHPFKRGNGGEGSHPDQFTVTQTDAVRWSLSKLVHYLFIRLFPLQQMARIKWGRGYPTDNKSCSPPAHQITRHKCNGSRKNKQGKHKTRLSCEDPKIRRTWSLLLCQRSLSPATSEPSDRRERGKIKLLCKSKIKRNKKWVEFLLKQLLPEDEKTDAESNYVWPASETFTSSIDRLVGDVKLAC